MTKPQISLTAAQQLLTPSPTMKIGFIQNTGGNPAWLTFDGSAPAANYGYLLAANATLAITLANGSPSIGIPAPWNPIKGMSPLGTTINVTTDDAYSS